MVGAARARVVGASGSLLRVAPCTPRLSTERRSQTGAVWVLGGAVDGAGNSEVWESTDCGITWTQLFEKSDIWSGRVHFGAAVLEVRGCTCKCCAAFP